MKFLKKIWVATKEFFKSVKDCVAKEISGFVKGSNFFKKFIFTYAVYFFGLLSIIQANFLYKTDVQRVAMEAGKENWRHSGRLLNDLLVFIFHFDSYPMDISPLSQLIGIFFLTICSLILVRTIANKGTYLALFFSTVLGLSPYFLQIINYNFDSLFYCLSVFFAVFPFLFYKNDKTFYLTSALGVFLTYMSWQASISIYMIIVTYLFWRDFCDKDTTFKKLLIKVVTTVFVFLLTSVLYTTFVYLLPFEDSAITQQGNFCELSDCWSVFSGNFKHATEGYFFSHWKNTPLGYAFLFVIGSYAIYILTSSFQSSKNQVVVFLNGLVGFISAFLMLFFIVLWTMFFPFIYWNARIWVGFGVCFAIMMIAMTNERVKIIRRIMMFFCFVLTWGCIVFATRVGNLLDIQKQYELFLFTSLSQDLMQFPKNKEIVFKHTRVHSPIVKVHGKEYPLLKDVVSGLQTQYFRFYAYFLDFYRPDLSMCGDLTIKYNKVLLNNAHYRFVQINDKCLRIDLK